jgi:hypothetical protein
MTQAFFSDIKKSALLNWNIYYNNHAFREGPWKDIDVSFVNFGGLRSNLSKGDITLEDVYAILPFSNTLDQVKMTGYGIKQVFLDTLSVRLRVLQVSGLQMEYMVRIALVGPFKICWKIYWVLKSHTSWIQSILRLHIMLRDLLTQKCAHKFLVTDFGYWFWIPQSMWFPKNITDKSI